MKLSVSAAFRAILAEPRNKTASADNDYFSNPRTEHSGNDPGSNSYTFGKYQATSSLVSIHAFVWKWQCSFWMPENLAWSWHGFLQHTSPAATPWWTRVALTLSPGACWYRHESWSHRSRSAVCLTWSRGWTSVRCREINTASAKVKHHTLLYNVISLCTTLLNCFKGLFSPKLQFYLCLFTINVSYATCELYTTTIEKFGLFCLKWINIVTRWGCIILINGKDVCSLSKYFWHK